MKRTIYILTTILITLSACTKTEKTPTSGTVTIDNTAYLGTTYYYYGFAFSRAKLVSSESDPGPDVTLVLNTDNTPSRLTFQADNYKPSFYKVGDFNDSESAKTAFNGLTSIVVSQWAEMADPVADNQVWLYRSGSERYAKIRIISTKNEVRSTIPFGECTFQWVYQPDGSLTFPGK